MLHAAAAVAEAAALAGTLAEEVELGAAGIAATDKLNRCDHGAVEGKLTFNADFIDDFADGDHLADAATFTDDDDALEDLLTFFFAFHDSEGDGDSIAYIKLGDVGLEIAGVDRFEQLL